MNDFRTVKKITRGRNAMDGAGVKLVRVIGRDDIYDYDPFLMLDAFDSSNPADYINGFPWHPHRGMETITYLIEGEIEHSDSLGNVGVISSGDCQWMTAGSGIIHQEMPKASKRLLGAQIWLNLPQKDKMVAPAYGEIKSNEIPVVKEDGVTVKVVAGEYNLNKGAYLGKHIDATYLDVQLDSNAVFQMNTKENDTLFIYIFDGSGVIQGTVVEEKSAVLLNKGKTFEIIANEGLRFILLSGTSLQEQVSWGGPVVMNTREEISKAFEELNDGTFIK